MQLANIHFWECELHEKSVDIKKILRELANHYELLKIFLPPYSEGAQVLPRYYVAQVAGIIEKDVTTASKLLDRLAEAGLLTYIEEPTGRGGRPYKYYMLSDIGYKLLRAIEDILNPPKAEEIDIKLERIKTCLEIMEDAEWSEELRLKYADVFFRIIISNPVLMLSRSDDLKKYFERFLEVPPLDKLSEKVRATISVSIPKLIQDESTKGWVLSELYPRILKLLNHPNKHVQLWAMNVLEDIGLLTEKRMEIVDTLLNILLNKDVDGLEKEVYENIVGKICRILTSRSAQKEIIDFLARLKTLKAKKRGKERIIEELLSRLAEYIPTD
jgi:DNA-binding transcriptional ArsR family regulator